MKKLYTATVELKFHVVADSVTSALHTAISNVGEAVNQRPEQIVDVELSTDIIDGWEGCLPYGDVLDATVEDYL